MLINVSELREQKRGKRQLENHKPSKTVGFGYVSKFNDLQQYHS
jgi:hypothetical protein